MTQPVEVIISSAHESTRSIHQDQLAVEEPLEIRIGCAASEGWCTRSVSITMRTPGSDIELAAGFLFTEGIIQHRSDIAEIQNVGPTGNIVRLDLQPNVNIDLAKLDRHFYTTSSCGVCGKASLEALSTRGLLSLPDSGVRFQSGQIHSLPPLLRQSQPMFEQTGGLHAAALFSAGGEMLSLREDVGRHNAVDKLIGEQFLSGNTPLRERLILVSGRASFELVQKAVVAGIPVMAAVGAPSSLAVELAVEFDLTLIGFLKAERFNIYSAPWRIV